MKCCCKTSKWEDCKVQADRQRGDKWYCHIHDPIGLFRLKHPRESPRYTKHKNAAKMNTGNLF